MPIWWAGKLKEMCWVRANGECFGLGISTFRQLTRLIRLTIQILIRTSHPDEVSRTLKTSSPILLTRLTHDSSPPLPVPENALIGWALTHND
jgi:hypothetical protein